MRSLALPVLSQKNYLCRQSSKIWPHDGTKNIICTGHNHTKQEKELFLHTPKRQLHYTIPIYVLVFLNYLHKNINWRDFFFIRETFGQNST